MKRRSSTTCLRSARLCRISCAVTCAFQLRRRLVKTAPWLTVATGSIKDVMRMRLLDRWPSLAEVGTLISRPEMRLDACDWEAPIVTGRGQIHVMSPATSSTSCVGFPTTSTIPCAALTGSARTRTMDLGGFGSTLRTTRATKSTDAGQYQRLICATDLSVS